jgi:multiple sugar transport system ATP-binding protein
MVYFTVNGQEICARVDPSAARGPGEQMRLAANIEHMHLIDPPTDTVL